jgi:hypothetical protein
LETLPLWWNAYDDMSVPLEAVKVDRYLGVGEIFNPQIGNKTSLAILAVCLYYYYSHENG